MAPEDQVVEATEGAPAEPAPSAPSGDPEAPVSPPSEQADPAPAEDTDPAPAEGTDPAPREDDLDALKAKAQQAEEYLELAQRTKADFENYRRRASRDAALAQERGAAKLAKEILPAIDNLERALLAAQTAALAAGEGDELHGQLVSGLDLVHADLVSALERSGIARFSPEGEPFDPQHHEAVAQQPVEGAQSGTIVEVYQRGYRIGDNVLRPARVVVAQ